MLINCQLYGSIETRQDFFPVLRNQSVCHSSIPISCATIKSEILNRKSGKYIHRKCVPRKNGNVLISFDIIAIKNDVDLLTVRPCLNNDTIIVVLAVGVGNKEID